MTQGPLSSGLVELHLIFDYVIQRTPTLKQRSTRTRRDTFNVYLNLAPNSLDDRGYPDPRALWFAERMFLEGFERKHLVNVRLLSWSSHLKGDSFILSDYRVLLPTSAD